MKKKLALFGILICCFCFMFICFAADYTQAGGPGKVTVFAADPDQGTFGMYREGNDYVFFEIKSKDDGGKVATSAKFHDEGMNLVAQSDKNSAAAYTPAATRVHQNLVSIAAGELQKHASLSHDVFIHEKSHLTDFQDLYSNRSLNKRDLKAAAAGIAPSHRALKAKDYFQGLHKNLKWKKVGTEMKGNYNGTILHGDYRVINDEWGDQDDPSKPRVERYGRMADAYGHNMVQQFGGHEIPDGYKVNLEPGDTPIGTDALTIENHFKYRGEAFMAGSVINSKDDFPAEEKEMFARMGSGIELLPFKGDPQAAASSGVLSKITNIANAVMDFFTPRETFAGAAWYQQRLGLWWHSLVWPANHSATVIEGSWYNSTNGVWYVNFTNYYCNHGTCARASGMNYKCQVWSSSNWNWWVPIPTSTVPSGQQGAGQRHSCNSAYGMDPNNRVHVCNDDSWTQIRAIRQESYCLNASCGDRCGDWSARPGVPNCTD
jgi:hypothetical protein